MAQVKLNLSQSIPIQIDQGVNAANMSKQVMTGTQPIILELETRNTALAVKHAAVIEARSVLTHAYAELREAATGQRVAFGNLGGLVQTNSDGDAAYISGCGFGIRSSGTPIPPVDSAPLDLRTRVNGEPGKVVFSWKRMSNARNYEAQVTSDLSGATGWESAEAMPSAAKITFSELISGTKYAFRVRAWGNGMPGPWSSPTQQMAS